MPVNIAVIFQCLLPARFKTYACKGYIAYLEALGAERVTLEDITAGDLVVGSTTLELEGARLVLPTCHVGVGSLFLSSSQTTGVVLIARPAMIAAARDAGADAYRIP